MKSGIFEKIDLAFKSVNPRLSKVFLPWILKNPRYVRGSAKLLEAFKESESLRDALLQEGLMVPPIMIMSITNRCNLKCKGCFASTLGNSGRSTYSKRTMESADWYRVIDQGRGLGIFTFLVAGGEPFMLPDLVDICGRNGDRIFVIFTNGTALNSDLFDKLRKTANTAVVVSVEGGEELTDERRGEGVFEKAVRSLEALNEVGVPGGISVTITRRNFRFWSDETNLDFFINRGAKLAFFTEYIPTGEVGASVVSRSPMGDLSVETSSEQFAILTSEERSYFRKRILDYKAKKPIFIVHSPGDEELFGGCVSAGKGFVHVNPYGDLTPCPVSDIATHNLLNSSLKEGLMSPLFKEIRENEGMLENGDGPCALFSHQKEVEELRKKLGAYKTGL